jgi:hypothetical protein
LPGPVVPGAGIGPCERSGFSEEKPSGSVRIFPSGMYGFRCFYNPLKNTYNVPAFDVGFPGAGKYVTRLFLRDRKKMVVFVSIFVCYS